MKNIFVNLDWRHWILSHLVWIIAISVALVIGHAALVEHDARVVAEAAIKASEAHVADLTKQIAATDAVAAQKTQAVVKIVHDAQTPAQQLAAVPLLSDVQLNARLLPVLSPNVPTQVAVDLAPLVQELGQCKQDSVQLTACQSDLKNEQAIVDLKQSEIAALKKKPSLWKRVLGVAKAVGVGIGIGVLLSGHL